MTELFSPRDTAFHARVAGMFENAKFARHLGVTYVDGGPGWCEARMLVQDHHLQQDEVVHGGAVATLADHTGGAAGISLIAANEIVLSVGYTVSFLRPGSGEALRCRAEVVRNGRRLIVVQSDVYAVKGAEERHIARATVTLAVLPTDHVK